MVPEQDSQEKPFRRLSIWVADGSDEAVVKVSQEEWHAVLNGERVMRSGQGYCYEGEAFQDEWRFNLDGPLSLEIGYSYGGTAFAGELFETDIERYDAASDDFTNLPAMCLEISSIDGLSVDIFAWAGLNMPDHLHDDASDRVWSNFNPNSLFEMLRSALVEEVEPENGEAPGTGDVRAEVWSVDCLLLRAELRRFLVAFLRNAK